MPPDRFEYHRQLRNVFAVLRALVRHTSAGYDTVAEFATRLESRIGALARVVDTSLRAPDDGVDLQEMILDEFLAQTVTHDRCEVGGPQIRITTLYVSALALAFHELALNALLHGALASRFGLVSVTWTCVQEDCTSWLLLRWRESGSALDPELPRPRGFGLEWIERTLGYELHTRSSIDFRGEGILVELRIPAVWPHASGKPIWRLSTEQ